MLTFLTSAAAFIHLYIFILESLRWGRPRTNRIFRVSAQTAEHNRLFAFNQGFYNLFLAAASISGLIYGVDSTVGQTLIAYSLGSMLMASLVLIFSNRNLLRPALIQGLPPFLGLLSLVFFYEY